MNAVAPTAEVPFDPVHPMFDHQREYMASAARRAYFGLLWEQGTGKSKALIDNMALLAVEGALDGAFVLAPNGVHRNWHVEQLPEHWPRGPVNERVPRLFSFSWDTLRSGNKGYQADWQAFLRRATAPDSQKVFAVLCMSYEGLMTDAGKKASWDFLRSGRRMYVSDESQRIKDPAINRTKRAIASSVYAPYRRIASGTPMDKPFDVYSQVRFLDPEFWMRELGIGTAVAFRKRFGNFYPATLTGGRTVDLLDSKNPYRDLDVLERALALISTRVEKDKALDLPPKVYKRMMHPLNAAQERAYRELKIELMTMLDSGELITADMALVLDGKLAQITSGFVREVAGGPNIRLGNENPRFRLVREVLEDRDWPCIIWARFVHDAEAAAEASERAGRRVVIYDGARPELSIDVFKAQGGSVPIDIIGNLHSTMTEGYTLVQARSMLYVSNTPRLIARQQSEDRAHRPGQRHNLEVLDFLAERTADAKRLSDLRAKRVHTGTVMGDDPEGIRAWLREAIEENEDA